MKAGGKAALLVSCMALGGCATSTNQVEVRPLADPSAVLRKGGDTVAVARAQLMLGNAGLAIEGFRQAQRDDPSNPAALAGLADSYASMGRFDLAQTNYEAALALAPHDRTLLLGLATVFERQGKIASAIAARADAAAAPPIVAKSVVTVTAAAAKAAAAVKPAMAMPAPSVGSVTVKLPTPRPAAPVHLPSEALRVAAVDTSSASVTAPLPLPLEPVRVSSKALASSEVDYSAVSSVTVPLPPAPEPVRVQSEALAPARVDYSAASSATVPFLPAKPIAEKVAVRAAPLRDQQDYSAIASAIGVPFETRRPDPARMALAQPRAEIVHLSTTTLVPSRAGIDYAALSSSITVPLPPARPVAPAPKSQEVTLRSGPSPRLERLSLGEVALVMTGKPIWTSAKTTASSSSAVQWVSLAPTGRPNIQILNAARSQGLAASARTVLLDRGWRKLDVGDAPATQGRSEVLYSKGRETLGRRLAAQFGVAARMVERDVLVLVLGRDSVDRIGGQHRS